MKSNRINILIFLCILSSCKIFSINDESIECLMADNECFFEGESISFVFSNSCNKKEVEDSIVLYENSITVDIDFSWTENQVSVKPKNNWKKGKFYILTFEGNIRLNGQLIQAYIRRTFQYGKKNEFLNVIEKDIKYPENLKEGLIIPFNNKIDFETINDIVVYPSIEFIKELSDDGCSLAVIPKDKWSPNIYYEIRLCNIRSKNAYYLEDWKSSFKVLKDTDLPILTSVCKVINNNGEYIYLDDNTSLNNLKKNDTIGFIFSKPMDLDSIKKGITFNPYVEGRIIQTDEDQRHFVFIPESNYKENQKYSMVVGKKIMDSNGIELYESQDISFIPVYEYIKIVEVKINRTNINLSDRDESTKFSPTIKNITTNDVTEAEFSVMISISFSHEFSKEEWKGVVDNIKLSLKFPMTVHSPVLRSIKWISPSKIIIEYDNLELSKTDSPVFYELKIYGGLSGLKNQFYEFLEETECFVLEPISE